MRTTLVMLAIVLMLATIGCGAARKTVTLNEYDAEVLQAIIKADIPRFVAHYSELHSAGRPPSDQEFGYWTAKYEDAGRAYAAAISRAVTSAGNDWLSLALQVGSALFGVTVVQ